MRINLYILLMTISLASFGTNRGKIHWVTPNSRTIRIGVIDSGLRADKLSREVRICSEGNRDILKQVDGLGYQEEHGSIVAQVLAEELKGLDYCLVIITGFAQGNHPMIQEGVKYLRSIGIDVINLSIAGYEFSYDEYDEMKNFTEGAGVAFVAAGNRKQNLGEFCNTFPACYRLKGIWVVGASTPGGSEKASYSNYGVPVTLWFDGRGGGTWEGTSFAAPRALAQYVRWRAQGK